MNFFQFFPKVDYRFQSPTGNSTLTITNTTAHVVLVEKAKQAITVFYDYVIQDGDRPDTVAQKVYGGVDFTWVVLLINNIFSLYDWPLTQNEFVAFITEKYGSIQAAQSTPLYRSVGNFFVDNDTYLLMPVSQRGLPISAYDYELDLNEAKRRIKVVPPAFLNPLMSELKKVFAS